MLRISVIANKCCLRSSKLVKNCTENKSKFAKYDNIVFNITGFTLELVMLACEHFEETNIKVANLNENGTSSTFQNSEILDII